MQLIMKTKRRSTTCVILLVSVFVVLYLHSSFPPFTDFPTFQALVQGRAKPELSPRGPITCDRSHRSYDMCSIPGPTLLDPNAATLYALGSTDISPPPAPAKIRPYPRKTDKVAMSKVKELTLRSTTPPGIQCDVTHHSPALVFSAGGYTGNFFHDINDGLIPIFVTVNSFSDEDFVLVVADHKAWWARKYAKPLSQFSHRPIVNLDQSNLTHCFPSSIVGLVSHGEMTVDPTLMLRPKTITDFRIFLSNTLAANNSSIPARAPISRPRLVVVRRRRSASRAILNERQVVEVAREVGFEVVVLDPIGVPLSDALKVVGGSHALVGVHGAGLTNEVFLRAGAVVMQVVPLGAEWVSRSFFEKPARGLGLEYMEYKIRASESSLMERFGNGSLVVRDPKAIVNGNWAVLYSLYLKNQDVTLDLVRFRGFLRKACTKAKRFMDLAG